MSDYSIGELIEIYTAHYSNYKGVNDQKRAMCQTFLKDLRIVNKRIKQLEDGISNIATEIFKLHEFYMRKGDDRAKEYLNIWKDLKALEK